MAKSKKNSPGKINLKNKSQIKAFDDLTRAKRKASRIKAKTGVSYAEQFKGLNMKAVSEMDFKDARKLSKELKVFIERKVLQEDFVKTGDGQYLTNEVADKVKEINEQTKAKAEATRKGLSEIEFKIDGKDSGMTALQLNEMKSKKHSTNIYDVPEIDIENDTKDHIEKRVKWMERNLDENYIMMRKIQYKVNHITNIYKRLNGTSGLEELIAELNTIPEDDYFELSQHFDDFKFLDPSDVINQENAEGEVQSMMARVKEYKDGKVDMRLNFI